MSESDDDDKVIPFPPSADEESEMAQGALRGEEYDRLMALALEASPEARAQAAQAIGAVYAERGEKLNAEEISITADILHGLIREIELPVRKALSENLAQSPHAPRELVVFLANDSIEAAYPVLCRSAVLEERDLIDVARLRSMQHRLAIAAREDVTEAVADALVSAEAPRGEPDVLKTLLENENAKISEAAMAFLVDEAHSKEPLRTPVLRRRELKSGQAKRLYWLVSAALRRRILETFPIDPLDLDEQLQATVDHLVRQDADSGADPMEKAKEVARRLKESDALSASMLVQALRQGHVHLFEAMFSEQLDLKLNVAQRVIYGEGGEALAIACRSIAVEKPAFASIFLLSRRARGVNKTVDPMEMSRALAVYDDMSADQAERMVRRWRLDSGFISAQLDLDLTTMKVVH